MKKTHRIAHEIKEQILKRIKEEGAPVAQAAKEHGISEPTIYSWLGKGLKEVPTLAELVKLKRQNEELLALVGELKFGGLAKVFNTLKKVIDDKAYWDMSEIEKLSTPKQKYIEHFAGKLKKPMDKVENKFHSFDSWIVTDINTASLIREWLDKLSRFPLALLTHECEWLQENDEHPDTWDTEVRNMLDLYKKDGIVVLIDCHF